MNPLPSFTSARIGGIRRVVLLSILIAILILVTPQNLRKESKGKIKRRREKRTVVNDQRLINSLTVNYPLHIFDVSNNDYDWRRPARFNRAFAEESTAEKLYTEVSKAQDQEDVWLYENWFYGMQSGVIMESGALNGLLFSTSFMFEKFANWTAIHVEADPENYASLKVNRQNAINIHGALCNEPKLLHYSSVGVIPVRGFIEFMSPSFIKKWHGRVYNNRTSIDELPTVQCLPVKRLLRELSVKHIDIWILDVEGAEESVLTGTDFETVHINAVAMECDEHDVSKNERKTSILERNGFKCQLVERNCMCKHEDYKPSAAPSLSTLRKWDGQKRAESYKVASNVV